MNAQIAAGMALTLFVALAGMDARADEHQFVGVRKCGTCHSKKLIGGQSTIWKQTAHARAYKTLSTDRAIELAAAAGLTQAPNEAPECLRCHVTGYGLPANRFPRGRVFLKDGVGCESCHGAGKDFRKKKVMSDRKLAESKGLKIPTDEDCRVCHNSESPAWDPKRYSRPDGTLDGFDFELAMQKIRHLIPKDVKGHYMEIEKRNRGGG